MYFLCAGAQKPVERWEFCISSTSHFFSYGLGSLYERSPDRLKNRDPTIKMVKKIFNQIRRTLTISLAHSRWYPMETKARLSAKVGIQENGAQNGVTHYTELLPTELLTTELLTTELFTTELLTTELLTTELLTTELLTTEVLTTEVLTTEVLTTEVLTTEVLLTELLITYVLII